MCFQSPLEQFLLLVDLPTLFVNILFYIPLNFNDDLFWWDTYFNAIYDFFLFDIITLNLMRWNFYITLVNLQYYKLSLFLIILLTLIANYNSKVYPTSLWQLLTQQSHIIAQSVLKPTFGAHYPFEMRFYNYYPIFYHIFIFILCNNLLGLIPYGFSNSAFIIHNFTLSFLFLSGLTLIVCLFKVFITINYLFQKIYQLI
jgi:F-type H+-transporting ATPase subunit a